MTDQKIKVGDIVVLKSGSPKMTATHEVTVSSYPLLVSLLVCQWYCHGEFREMKCKPEALLLAKDHPELVEQE